MKTKRIITKRIVDIGMTILLLCLMAYQVTGEAGHEWIGMAMTALVVVHQILNRKWYEALFKGKYHLYRILSTTVNILLLLAFAITAFCGMAMSGYAVPFLYGMVPISFARQMHLSMSHWAFVLMGLHLGMHLPVMVVGKSCSVRVKKILVATATLLAGVGLYLFLKNGIMDYLLFRVSFAFLDFDKAPILVFLENVLMLWLWVFVGAVVAKICRMERLK